MKFTIKDQTPEPTVELWLEDNGDGTVSLCARHDDDDDKSLLTITRQGTLLRYPCAQLPGIKTNEAGRILVEDE